MKLQDRTALVTGGGTGIGLAITQALVRAGVHVIIAGRDLARLERVRTDLGNVTVVQADLARSEDRERLIAEVLHGERRLDLLINNAGTMQYSALADDRALTRLDAELALDLHAPIHLATAPSPSPDTARCRDRQRDHRADLRPVRQHAWLQHGQG